MQSLDRIRHIHLPFHYGVRFSVARRRNSHRRTQHEKLSHTTAYSHLARRLRRLSTHCRLCWHHMLLHTRRELGKKNNAIVVKHLPLHLANRW